jgi:hypothetical protein
MSRIISGLQGWMRRPADRDALRVWAKTEWGQDAGWAMTYYEQKGRFPRNGKEI